MELLPGDRENLAIQTRGGPEKHEVTGWVLVSISCVPPREAVGKPEGAAVPPCNGVLSICECDGSQLQGSWESTGQGSGSCTTCQSRGGNREREQSEPAILQK